jgi:uncharacterized protein YbjT (DUF2867 family)
VPLVSGGKLSKVAHFDSKAHVEEYVRSLGIPATFFLPGFYMSNIPGQSLNNMQGPYSFALPIPTDSPMPLFDTERDTGKFIKAILLHREQTLGKQILGATDYYTPEQIIADFQAVKSQEGQGGKAIQVPEAAFKKVLAGKGLPEPVQDEMLENMLLMPQFGYYGGASLKESHAVSFYECTSEFLACTLFPCYWWAVLSHQSYTKPLSITTLLQIPG